MTNTSRRLSERRNAYGRALSRMQREDRLLRRAISRSVLNQKAKYSGGPPYEVGLDERVAGLPKEWR